MSDKVQFMEVEFDDFMMEPEKTIIHSYDITKAQKEGQLHTDKESVMEGTSHLYIHGTRFYLGNTIGVTVRGYKNTRTGEIKLVVYGSNGRVVYEVKC